jgi:tetratricopeptide (TPR) repeat protein
MSARRTGRALGFSTLAATLALTLAFATLSLAQEAAPSPSAVPSSPPPPPAALEAEEAADFARRAAFAALHGPPKIFFASIDADAVLRHILSTPVWGALTERQKSLLAATVREHFARALAPPPGTTAEVAWASIPPAGDAAGATAVDLGLRYGDRVLKTRWLVRRGPRGWAVEDVLLSDPGLSLAAEIGRQLGREPVRRRDRASEALSRAWPRLAGVLALAAIVLVFRRRLPSERRWLLWIAAAVPATLFAVDAALAIRRTFVEPFALSDPPAQPWRPFEQAAIEAQRVGDWPAARAAWTKALEAGARRAQVDYQMGLAARAGGDPFAARGDFERALAEDPPAPGAAKELAGMALAEGRTAEARQLLERYLREAGPDPETLATLAVVQANAGEGDAAVRTIREARALLPEGWRRAELEAQIYARAGDASATVAALRPLQAEGRLDRDALRADPAYVPIAADPVWVGFLAEDAVGQQ